ncbi:arginine biosynthesis protein ArgJ [Coniophora puteana RWD-64-598 SS2]|uniref:Arginine biosynthesis bifunctional protein ArgJ, mitochondrial n=1 Tax=Coniophora puteana (strain RWD-64-598) TaxID=741705 RepID=A0A5M3MJP5_CONPW|nr:arginine biosynthesis protein ArgJ [Coniophora puteana RWD-64-598 SS2]EIW78855.1 arginine biosynthesis protein ArgJ [Coniophora puteana RWD-64-598 SS2]
MRRLPRLVRPFSTAPSAPITPRPSPPKSHLHFAPESNALPRGYALAGVYAGVKKKPTDPNAQPPPDLTLVVSTTPAPAAAAAVFTRNAFRAAPVRVCEAVLEEGGARVRGIVANSGCANAVTGKQGDEDAWAMVKATDALFKPLESSPSPSSTAPSSMVLSTGVIGVPLPATRILDAIRAQHPSAPNTQLASTPEAWVAAARGIMTTDTFPKLRARTFEMGGKTYRIAGMDKGAGMIHPDMGSPQPSTFKGTPFLGQASAGPAPPKGAHATLLGLILTDAPVAPKALQSALEYAIARSFNTISVDGAESTNDTVILLANGAGALESPPTLATLTAALEIQGQAGESDAKGLDTTVTTSGAASAGAIGEVENVVEITEEGDPAAFKAFRDALTGIAGDLAQLVVRDGEGATKFVEVKVKGAATFEDANLIARAISTSALVKTALYGEDANWGRILSATGSVAARLSTPIDPSRVSVTFTSNPTSSSTPPSPSSPRFTPSVTPSELASKPPVSSSTPGAQFRDAQGKIKDLEVLQGGEPIGFSEEHAKVLLGEEDFGIVLDLGVGSEEGRCWTCDFSYEYVRINGDYRS